MLVEGRGLSSRRTRNVGRDRGLGNLSTPKSVQKPQTALHVKANAEPGYRFSALYDKIRREDILAHAYAKCRSNKGAPVVDGQEFADIEAYGVARWLAELALALTEKTYRPEPIRRVQIPKPTANSCPARSSGNSQRPTDLRCGRPYRLQRATFVETAMSKGRI